MALIPLAWAEGETCGPNAVVGGEAPQQRRGEVPASVQAQEQQPDGMVWEGKGGV
jgi:hypothetical protein